MTGSAKSTYPRTVLELTGDEYDENQVIYMDLNRPIVIFFAFAYFADRHWIGIAHESF